MKSSAERHLSLEAASAMPLSKSPTRSKKPAKDARGRSFGRATQRAMCEAISRAEARIYWPRSSRASTSQVNPMAFEQTTEGPSHAPSDLTRLDRRARLEQARLELEREFGESVTLDGLTGEWFIFQRAGGHRHSVDDVLTAAYALEVSRRVDRHLDLGAGIGSVGLLVLWGMGQSASLTAIEAQKVSHRLLVANLAANGLSERVQPLLGDLREFESNERFPLITGSPPYFPITAGIVPQD